MSKSSIIGMKELRNRFPDLNKPEITIYGRIEKSATVHLIIYTIGKRCHKSQLQLREFHLNAASRIFFPSKQVISLLVDEEDLNEIMTSLACVSTTHFPLEPKEPEEGW